MISSKLIDTTGLRPFQVRNLVEAIFQGYRVSFTIENGRHGPKAIYYVYKRMNRKSRSGGFKNPHWSKRIIAIHDINVKTVVIYRDWYREDLLMKDTK